MNELLINNQPLSLHMKYWEEHVVERWRGHIFKSVHRSMYWKLNSVLNRREGNVLLGPIRLN